MSLIKKIISMNIGFYYNRIYSCKSLKYKDESQLQASNLKEKWLLEKMKEINDELTVKRNYSELNNDLFIKGLHKPFTLKTIYPGLATGTGMGHEADVKGELKLGFYFDYTTGQPVIPGSTIKGVLRSAFPQWENHRKTTEEKKWAKTAYIYILLEKKIEESGKEFRERWNKLMQQWDNFDETKKIEQKEKIITIEKEIFDGVIYGKNLPIYQRDIFHDAYISGGTTLKPGKNRILGTDSITPHNLFQDGMSYESSMLKNPTTIPFLKILPDVELSFNFVLQDHKEMNVDLIDIEKKLDIFKQILLDFGIGAKTNVGYGQFEKFDENKK
jgi:CRISPR-associated protein Cmr6